MNSLKQFASNLFLNLFITLSAPFITPFLWLAEKIWTLCVFFALILACSRYWFSLESRVRADLFIDLFVLILWTVHFGPTFLCVLLNYILLKTDQTSLATLNSILSYICLHYSSYILSLQTAVYPKFSEYLYAVIHNQSLWEQFSDLVIRI